MKSAVHFYWNKVRGFFGPRTAPSGEPHGQAPAPPADASWLEASALGEEDPGASLDALEGRTRPLNEGERPPH